MHIGNYRWLKRAKCAVRTLDVLLPRHDRLKKEVRQLRKKVLLLKSLIPPVQRSRV